MPSLRDLRLRKFLTQTRLAERLGVPYQMVQRWEVGKAHPRPANMEKLAEVLEVSGEELLAAVKEARSGEAAKQAAS
jgi:transcriptional regulator with XRE-family HTH domain